MVAMSTTLPLLGRQVGKHSRSTHPRETENERAAWQHFAMKREKALDRRVSAPAAFSREDKAALVNSAVDKRVTEHFARKRSVGKRMRLVRAHFSRKLSPFSGRTSPERKEERAHAEKF
jgi:hypothetical protein